MQLLREWERRLPGDVDPTGWLSFFLEAPAEAVDQLLRDIFCFGPLNTVDRIQLVTGWLDLLGNSRGFAKRLDEELAVWVKKNWGRVDSPEASMSQWSFLCRIVSFSAKLHTDGQMRKCALALRSHFAERDFFQELLGATNSVLPDALGHYLEAIAEFQDDRLLADVWWGMIRLPDRAMWYHLGYAMLGIRRMKALDPAEDGTLRPEIVEALLQLAKSLDDFAGDDDEDLEHLAERIFREIAGGMATAYPGSPGWRRHGKLVDGLSPRARKWLTESVPDLVLA